MKPSRIVIVGAGLGILLLFTVMRSGNKTESDTQSGMSRPDSTTHREPRGDGGSTIDFFSRIFSSGDGDPKSKPEAEEPSEEPAPPHNEMFTLVDRVSKGENLPRNLLFPTGVSKEKIEEHTQHLKELVLYGELIRKGEASVQQRIRYYEIKIKMLEDKRGLIRHYQSIQASEEDREQGEKNLKLLDEKIAAYQEELRKI